MSSMRLMLGSLAGVAATLLAMTCVVPAVAAAPAYTASKLKVTASPPTVTKGSQAVTFSGKLTGTTASGGQAGIAGAPVDLSIAGGTSSQIATTGAGGAFSYRLTGIKRTAGYDFTVAATGTYPAAAKDVTVKAVQAASAMTAAASAATVTEGSQQVVFTGTVTVTAAGGTAAGIGSGVPVDLSVDGGPATQVTTTDKSNGDFSYTRRGISHTHAYTFSVAATPLYTAASAPAVTVTTVQSPSAMTLKATPALVTFGSQRVTFTGTVTAIPAGGHAIGVGSGVPVDLSINGGPVTPVTATDDANGDFTYTILNITRTATYAFSVAPTTIRTAATDAVTVHLYPGKAALAVTANPPDVNLGSHTVVFSGTVSVTPFGRTKAVGAGSGVPVYLAVGSGPATLVTTTDDPAGDFSYTVTGITKAADYDFSVAATRFHSAAAQDVPIGLKQVVATMTVTPSSTSITEGSQSVTFSGSLTGVAPGSTARVSIKNAPVDLSVNAGPGSKVATTDKTGHFTDTISDIAKAGQYAFSVAATKTYTTAADEVQIGAVQAPTRITGISVSPAHLKYGQKATLKGTVQYLRGTTWTALPAVTVQPEAGSARLGSVTTGSNGSFRASLPTTHGPSWRATVSAGTLTQQTAEIGNLSIAVPLRVRSFAASLQADGEVRASGCLQVTVPVSYGPQTTVTIQYSARRRGPWRSLGKLPLRNTAHKQRSCGSANESDFSGDIRHRLANAYYRADFPASYSFQSAVSKAVHSWRYETRITGFVVRPRLVASGKNVTIRGRLWQRGRSWKPYSHRRVAYIYNVKGTSFWGNLGTTRTSSGGDFSLIAVAGKGTFVIVIYAEYGGDRDHLAVRTPGVAVSIRS